MDGFRVEIVWRIHGDDDYRVGDIFRMFCDFEEEDDDYGSEDEGDEEDVGRQPKQSDI